MYTPIRENLGSLEGAKLDALANLFSKAGTTLFPVYQKYDIWKRQREERKRIQEATAERIRIEKLIRQQEMERAQTSTAFPASAGMASISGYAPYILGGLGILVLLKRRGK